MTRLSVSAALVGLSLLPAACDGGGGSAGIDAASIDGGMPDASEPTDAGGSDAEPPDAEPPPDAALPVVTTAQLSAGFAHTCLLLPTGRIKCWGANDYGQLGLGDTRHRGDEPGELGSNLPLIRLDEARYAIAIAAGFDHTCALLDDHTVRCWGHNDYGQLGLGDTNDRGDEPGELGDALPAIDLGTGRTALAISAGSSTTCALLDDHKVKCWGRNDQGQLGQGDTNHRGDGPGELGDALPAVALGGSFAATQIGSGFYFNCAMTAEGDSKCWGASSEGQLGRGNTQTIGDGPNEMGDALAVIPLGTGRTTAQLAVGDFHVCARFTDGAIKCFGPGNSGQLGSGDQQNRGDNPGEMGDSLPVVDVGTGRTVRDLAMTQSDTCALLDDDTVKCWGYNFFGQAGQGHTLHLGDGPGEMGDALLPVPLPAGRAVRQVVGGGEHMCVLFADDGVRCWGYGNQGQLGQGNTATIGDAPGEIDALDDVRVTGAAP